MLDTILAWLAGFEIAPRLVVAIAIGLVVSMAGTQALKSALRGTEYALHGWIARVIAFLLGVVATFTITHGRGVLEFWAAVAVGLLSPLVYKVFVSWAGGKWKWAENLSGDRDDS